VRTDEGESKERKSNESQPGDREEHEGRKDWGEGGEPVSSWQPVNIKRVET